MTQTCEGLVLLDLDVGDELHALRARVGSSHAVDIGGHGTRAHAEDVLEVSDVLLKQAVHARVIAEIVVGSEVDPIFDVLLDCPDVGPSMASCPTETLMTMLGAMTFRAEAGPFADPSAAMRLDTPAIAFVGCCSIFKTSRYFLIIVSNRN